MNETYDVSAFRAVFERSFTWISGFLRNVRRFGEKTAVIDPASGRTWTYAALNQDANRLANACLPRASARATWCSTSFTTRRSLSCPTLRRRSSGAINEPANFNLAAGETARLLDRDQPKSTSTTATSRRWPQRPSLSPPTSLRSCWRSMPRASGPRCPKDIGFFDDVLAVFPDTEPITNHIPNLYDEVTRLGTSGTTRHAQGCAAELRERGTLRARRDHALPLTPNDVTMNMTPWFHPAGCTPVDRPPHSTPGPRLWSCGCSARRRASMPWDDTASRF